MSGDQRVAVLYIEDAKLMRTSTMGTHWPISEESRLCPQCCTVLLLSGVFGTFARWSAGWCSNCFAEFLVPWPEGWDND